MGGYMDGWRSKRPLCNPSKKPLFFIEKMLRVLEIFLVKNSSPFFSKLVRVRGPNHYILLIGTIKPYNICYWHFLLRSFLSEIFNDPFHQTKKGETNKTVLLLKFFWLLHISMIFYFNTYSFFIAFFQVMISILLKWQKILYTFKRSQNITKKF